MFGNFSLFQCLFVLSSLNSRVRCESDSTQLVKALTASSGSMEIYGIVADILKLTLFFDVLSFHWISREKNREADFLAKQCLVVSQAVALNSGT